LLFTQVEFIFIFLPIAWFGYFFLFNRSRARVDAQVVWLAFASLCFYAYWDIRFLPIIATSIICNYLFGVIISNQPAKSRARNWTFFLAIACNLAALGTFKYANFAIGILNSVADLKLHSVSIELPLGISFFTFTQIAYLADVFGGYRSEKNFGKYVLFVTYFPHLIAGPILHHSEMMPQFGAKENRGFSAERTSIGLTVFAIGLFKKAIIADGFALIANPIFTAVASGTGHVTAADAWVGALAYSLQIYFDFSGYSDMAIGLSTMFGIRLPFNFDAPYKSQSIIEFWRRWHITLSRFLRDYLYIPLGGSRKGAARRSLNLAVTMLLGGLWHGAGWTYVLWGALHGLYLGINHLWIEIRNQVPVLGRLSQTLWFACFSLLLTQVAVVIAWVYFRADNIRVAHRMLGAMLGLAKPEDLAKASSTSTVDVALIAVGYLICIALPHVNAIFRQWHIGLDTYKSPTPWNICDIRFSLEPRWALGAGVLLLLGIFVSFVAGDGSQFLYFQF
jgi:alginate O-acetyltransferase complex protein AlgI